MKNRISDTRLMGYCGLYCGACDVHRAYQSGRETGRMPEWADLPLRLTRHLPFKPQPVVCQGCRSDTVFGGCAKCFIRKCARKKGDVEICTECDRYPCIRFGLFSAAAKLFSIEKKLPHLTVKSGNLSRIALVGKDTWLREQRESWQCPECRTPFSWYSETCAVCGTGLTQLKGF